MKKYIILFLCMFAQNSQSQNYDWSANGTRKYLDEIKIGSYFDKNSTIVYDNVKGNASWEPYKSVNVAEKTENTTTYCFRFLTTDGIYLYQIRYTIYYVCVGNTTNKVLSIKTYIKDGFYHVLG